MKQETIGIIFNWDISTMHPLCPPQNIAWQYMVTYLMSPEIPKILAVLLLKIVTGSTFSSFISVGYCA